MADILMPQDSVHPKDVQNRPLHSEICSPFEGRKHIRPREQGKAASMPGPLITKASSSTSDGGGQTGGPSSRNPRTGKEQFAPSVPGGVVVEV